MHARTPIRERAPPLVVFLITIIVMITKWTQLKIAVGAILTNLLVRLRFASVCACAFLSH